MLDPKEIMRRFPVGTILELQTETKIRIKFLVSVLDSIDLVQRHLAEKFAGRAEQGQPVTGEEITETLDTLLANRPFEGMVSVALGNGWNSPDALIHARNNSNCLRKIVWSIIYSDIVQDYDIDRQTWLKLKLSLLENPPGAGVLVRGYEFDEKDFGHKGSSEGKCDICPDYPPANFLDEAGD